ncbi:MAG: MBL fold metallo-hydrolase [Clostridiales bacterium]|nr:MBL fold metallo-hydrolase [Clostridiales bacterium]
MQVEVTFLSYSGFSISVGQHFLMFDYFRGLFPGNQIKQHKYALAFASHSHRDHFNKKIFHMSQYNPGARYILSDDIKHKNEQARYMKPGDSWKADDIEVHAFGSTDIGVSYGIICEGIKIFHAGDLNLWSWRAQSTQEEIEEATTQFYQELNQIPIKMDQFDIAFFPVDPRLRKDMGEGADVFLDTVDVKHMFPMHFWGRYKTVKKFEKNYEGNTIIHTPEKSGQQFNIQINEDKGVKNEI